MWRLPRTSSLSLFSRLRQYDEHMNTLPSSAEAESYSVIPGSSGFDIHSYIQKSLSTVSHASLEKQLIGDVAKAYTSTEAEQKELIRDHLGTFIDGRDAMKSVIQADQALFSGDALMAIAYVFENGKAQCEKLVRPIMTAHAGVQQTRAHRELLSKFQILTAAPALLYQVCGARIAVPVSGVADEDSEEDCGGEQQDAGGRREGDSGWKSREDDGLKAAAVDLTYHLEAGEQLLWWCGVPIAQITSPLPSPASWGGAADGSGWRTPGSSAVPSLEEAVVALRRVFTLLEEHVDLETGKLKQPQSAGTTSRSNGEQQAHHSGTTPGSPLLSRSGEGEDLFSPRDGTSVSSPGRSRSRGGDAGGEGGGGGEEVTVRFFVSYLSALLRAAQYLQSYLADVHLPRLYPSDTVRVEDTLNAMTEVAVMIVKLRGLWHALSNKPLPTHISESHLSPLASFSPSAMVSAVHPVQHYLQLLGWQVDNHVGKTLLKLCDESRYFRGELGPLSRLPSEDAIRVCASCQGDVPPPPSSAGSLSIALSVMLELEGVEEQEREPEQTSVGIPGGARQRRMMKKEYSVMPLVEEAVVMAIAGASRASTGKSYSTTGAAGGASPIDEASFDQQQEYIDGTGKPRLICFVRHVLFTLEHFLTRYWSGVGQSVHSHHFDVDCFTVSDASREKRTLWPSLALQREAEAEARRLHRHHSSPAAAASPGAGGDDVLLDEEDSHGFHIPPLRFTPQVIAVSLREESDVGDEARAEEEEDEEEVVEKRGFLQCARLNVKDEGGEEPSLTLREASQAMMVALIKRVRGWLESIITVFANNAVAHGIVNSLRLRADGHGAGGRRSTGGGCASEESGEEPMEGAASHCRHSEGEEDKEVRAALLVEAVLNMLEEMMNEVGETTQRMMMVLEDSFVAASSQPSATKELVEAELASSSEMLVELESMRAGSLQCYLRAVGLTLTSLLAAIPHLSGVGRSFSTLEESVRARLNRHHFTSSFVSKLLNQFSVMLDRSVHLLSNEWSEAAPADVRLPQTRRLLEGAGKADPEQLQQQLIIRAGQLRTFHALLRQEHLVTLRTLLYHLIGSLCLTAVDGSYIKCLSSLRIHHSGQQATVEALADLLSMRSVAIPLLLDHMIMPCLVEPAARDAVRYAAQEPETAGTEEGAVKKSAALTLVAALKEERELFMKTALNGLEERVQLVLSAALDIHLTDSQQRITRIVQEAYVKAELDWQRPSPHATHAVRTYVSSALLVVVEGFHGVQWIRQPVLAEAAVQLLLAHLALCVITAITADGSGCELLAEDCSAAYYTQGSAVLVEAEVATVAELLRSFIANRQPLPAFTLARDNLTRFQEAIASRRREALEAGMGKGGQEEHISTQRVKLMASKGVASLKPHLDVLTADIEAERTSNDSSIRNLTVTTGNAAQSFLSSDVTARIVQRLAKQLEAANPTTLTPESSPTLAAHKQHFSGKPATTPVGPTPEATAAAAPSRAFPKRRSRGKPVVVIKEEGEAQPEGAEETGKTKLCPPPLQPEGLNAREKHDLDGVPEGDTKQTGGGEELDADMDEATRRYLEVIERGKRIMMSGGRQGSKGNSQHGGEEGPSPHRTRATGARAGGAGLAPLRQRRDSLTKANVTMNSSTVDELGLAKRRHRFARSKAI